MWCMCKQNTSSFLMCASLHSILCENYEHFAYCLHVPIQCLYVKSGLHLTAWKTLMYSPNEPSKSMKLGQLRIWATNTAKIFIPV